MPTICANLRWNPDARQAILGPGKVAYAKDIPMHRFIKLGLAAAVASLISGTTLAQTTGSVGEPAVVAEVNDAATLNFVEAAGLSAGDPMKAEAVINMIAGNRGTLHAEINANAALKAKIEGAGHAVEDVLYIKSDGGGIYTVYVD
jgi:hypothetical protein